MSTPAVKGQGCVKGRVCGQDDRLGGRYEDGQGGRHEVGQGGRYEGGQGGQYEGGQGGRHGGGQGGRHEGGQGGQHGGPHVGGQGGLFGGLHGGGHVDHHGGLEVGAQRAPRLLVYILGTRARIILRTLTFYITRVFVFSIVFFKNFLLSPLPRGDFAQAGMKFTEVSSYSGSLVLAMIFFSKQD